MDNVFQMHQRIEVTRKSLTSKLVETGRNTYQSKNFIAELSGEMNVTEQCHKLQLLSYWSLSVHNSESQSLWSKEVIERLQSFVSFIS